MMPAEYQASDPEVRAVRTATTAMSTLSGFGNVSDIPSIDLSQTKCRRSVVSGRSPTGKNHIAGLPSGIRLAHRAVAG